MAIEFKNQTPAQESYVDPRACEARVEVEVFSEYDAIKIAGTGINCQKCNLHQLFDSVGTEQEISGDVQSKVTEVIGERCLKLRSFRQNVPEELLPQARLL